ncbi:MAG: hypothetical protein WC551_02720 [Patescibacteria group bacterium]
MTNIYKKLAEAVEKSRAIVGGQTDTLSCDKLIAELNKLAHDEDGCVFCSGDKSVSSLCRHDEAAIRAVQAQDEMSGTHMSTNQYFKT